MKKLKILILIAVLGFVSTSCERDITEPAISPNPISPVAADVALTADFNVNNLDSLLRFSWAKSDFGFDASVTYSLQMSPQSDFSSKVATLFTTQNLKGTAKVGDVNAMILSWDYDFGSPVTVYFRVAANVSTNVPTIYSAAKSKSLTPFDAVINYPMVYAPGSYQGWGPGNENGRLFSYNFNSTYEGILRLVNGSEPNVYFKITLVANWNGTNYGGTLTKSGNNYSGTLDPTGGDISVAPGMYIVSFNTDTKELNLTKTNDWGIIGSAIPPFDWSRDVDLFYNGQRQMWEITGDFHAGEFKIRANDAWDLDYGGGNGTLVAKASNNIPLAEAGNYTIRFSLSKLTYSIKKN